MINDEWRIDQDNSIYLQRFHLSAKVEPMLHLVRVCWYVSQKPLSLWVESGWD